MTYRVRVAPGSTPQVRGLWGVLGLLLVTVSLYSLVLWHRIMTDLRERELATNGHSDIDPATETAILVGTYAAAVAVAVLTGSGAGAAAMVLFPCIRVLPTVQRAYAECGVPRDGAPGNRFYLWTILFGIIGLCMATQSTLNKLWRRFPPDDMASPALSSAYAMPPQEHALAQAAAPSLLHAVPGIEPAMQNPMLLQLPPPQHAPSSAAMTPVEVIERLRGRAEQGMLSGEEGAQLARSLREVYGEDAAEPWYAWTCERFPEVAESAYWYGRRLLERGDDRGIELLRGAPVADPACSADARMALANYLMSHGRIDEARQFMQLGSS